MNVNIATLLDLVDTKVERQVDPNNDSVVTVLEESFMKGIHLVTNSVNS